MYVSTSSAAQGRGGRFKDKEPIKKASHPLSLSFSLPLSLPPSLPRSLSLSLPPSLPRS